MRLFKSFTISNISFSLSVSNELVNSSRINNLGLSIIALAIPILCFWPPDNLDPLSPAPFSL